MKKETELKLQQLIWFNEISKFNSDLNLSILSRINLKADLEFCIKNLIDIHWQDYWLMNLINIKNVKGYGKLLNALVTRIFKQDDEVVETINKITTNSVNYLIDLMTVQYALFNHFQLENASFVFNLHFYDKDALTLLSANKKYDLLNDETFKEIYPELYDYYLHHELEFFNLYTIRQLIKNTYFKEKEE